MSIIFKPNGTLNVSVDPASLEETIEDRSIYSEQMQRCKNLRLDQMGIIQTRFGSDKLHGAARLTPIWTLIEQGGTRYAFGGSTIYQNESTSVETGLASALWSAILYNAYNDTTQQVFCLNGTDRRRIEGSSTYKWGIAAPTSAPTLAAGAKTGLTGDYNAKYTYCRKSGATVVCESDPSPAGAASVTLSDDSLSVTWTASSDSQVTHVRVYRTAADGLIYYHDQDVAVGTVTVDTNTADSALGSEVATNHDRPPAGTFVAGPYYNGTCFIVKDNLLYYCLPKQPEYWPPTYYIEVSRPQDPGQCLIIYGGTPYYLTKQKIYTIQGTGHNSFFPYPTEALCGAQGPAGAIGVYGKGLYHVGPDGLYLYSMWGDKKVSQELFEPIFKGESVGGIPAAGNLGNAWLITFHDNLYFGFPGEDDTYPSNILVFNLTNDRVTYYDYSTEFSCVAVDYENDRLLAGSSDGYVWVLEVSWSTTDNDAVIAWEVETKDYTMQTRRHFPRYVKYDVDASDDGCTATGTVLLDGVSHQTHAITGNRLTKRRLVDTGNGRRESIRISGTGPVKIYAVEAE